MENARVAVVIPYFQRKSGILQRSLSSAFDQTIAVRLSIFIVDDGSPIPAESEVVGLSPSQFECITIIHQQNSGPAAARNAALDALPPDTQYVAFLDSDDCWTPDHIERALHALSAGYDFYFSDFLQLNASVSAFKRAARIDISRHKPIEGDGFFEFTGDLFDQTLTGNVIGTPTVVFRFQSFRQLRFQTRFILVGEDYLFWMELARLGAHPVFSTHIEAKCGEGVNVYSGSGWGAELSIDRICQEIAFRKATRELFQLTSSQGQHVRQALRNLRRAFALDLAHRLRNHKQLRIRTLSKHFRTDPLSFAMLAPYVMIALISAQHQPRVRS